MKYIISPPEETIWTVSREQFLGALRHEWPAVEAQVAPDGDELQTRDIVWDLPCDNGPMEGSIDQAGQAIFLDGPMKAMAEFAHW
jgi:hypothetical protein